jgi:hypothetical protein
MSWVIRGFERDGDELTTEIEVDDLIREWFRATLDVSPKDPMFDVFPLPRDVLVRFLGFFGNTDFDQKEDFFLDYEVEPPESG